MSQTFFLSNKPHNIFLFPLPHKSSLQKLMDHTSTTPNTSCLFNQL
uniref:Uncharacterized protein n=1 Tax=Rhizophora mucronata TaxID=61149 RepID=A0A2P2NV81_RHIMU